MPRLSIERKTAMQGSTGVLSVDGNILAWTTHPTYSALVGQPIIGSGASWLNAWTLIFQSCQTPTSTNDGAACRLYTYDIRTAAVTQVSSSGATTLAAGGDIWAATLGSNYRDSKGRTSSTLGVKDVDDAGTVLVTLDNTKNSGLGYLTSTDATASDVTVICYDQLDSPIATIRNGVIVYRANGVLNRYVIATDKFSTTNVPVALGRNDGSWIVGRHPNGLDTVVFEFGKVYGYQVSTGTQDVHPDIRVATDGTITVVTSTSDGETPTEIRRYTVNQAGTTYFLFSDKNKPYKLDNGTGPLDPGPQVTGSDVITIGRNPGGSEQGFAKVISSNDWYGDTFGHYIRGAWQYGITAVISPDLYGANTHAQVRDSNGHTFNCNNEVAYGAHSVAIRPDPATSQSTPIWEATWVQSPGTAYRRARLDANLAVIGSITTTSATFGSHGMLDLYGNGTPIITDDHQNEWYGYVKIGYATTRGEWTIGQDVSPTCTVNRLIAWNSVTQKAYVVWNGTTTLQSRLALEYDGSGNASPVVVPALTTTAIRFTQFLPLGQLDVETGKTPGIELPPIPVPPPVPSNPPSATSGTPNDPSPAALKKDTRVFRQPQGIPPTTQVLAAAAKLPDTSSGSGGSGLSMEIGRAHV